MNARVSKFSVSLTLACLSITGLPGICVANSAGAQSVALTSLLSRAPYDRIHAPQLRPRQIRTFGLRADRVGDTVSSSRYYKITNISAEVGGSAGIAYAVNNDGRIAYTDFPATGSTAAYVVNNGGTFGKLVAPRGVPRQTGLSAYAINEKAEVVGAFQNGSLSGHIAWTLSGARSSSVAYWGSTDVFGSETAVNNHEVGAGWSANTASGYAAVFEGLSKPAGKTIGLRDLIGGSCQGDTANAINDAGEIVGNSCLSLTAVRYSLTGYAERLPITPASLASFAFAMNQQGDVVGQAGFAPFGGAYLLRGGKTIYLPLPKGSPNFIQFTAYGVNAKDEVVGDLCTNGCGAFLYTNGRTYDLNTLIPPNSGWLIADALGINDRGEIVGDGYYNGLLRGISLKPPNF